MIRGAIVVPLIPETADYQSYLAPSDVIDWEQPEIVSIAQQLTAGMTDEIDRVRTIYHYVRDRISHSCDIASKTVTCIASDVLRHREGICFAKSHLLAAMLRSVGVPTGLCYQRLVFDDDQPDRFGLHGLNAVYLHSLDRWVRLDARGNKLGVQAEFNLEQEQIAYPARSAWREVDYPIVYVQPNQKVIRVLTKNDTVQELLDRLPEGVEG